MPKGGSIAWARRCSRFDQRSSPIPIVSVPQEVSRYAMPEVKTLAPVLPPNRKTMAAAIDKHSA